MSQAGQPPELWRLLAMVSLACAAFSGARLALTLMALDLGASKLVTGFIAGLVMAVPMLVSVPSGRWADRVGFSRPALGGLFILLLGCVTAAATGSLTTLFCVGLTLGSGFMLAYIALGQAFGSVGNTADRTSVFGLMALSMSVAGVVGPVLVGFAIEHWGYVWTWSLLASGPAVAMAVGLGAGGRRVSHLRVDDEARGSIGDLLAMQTLRRALLVSAVVAFAWDFFSFIVPLHGSSQGLSSSLVGVVVGAFGCGGLMARIALPWLGRRLHEWRLLAVCLALAAALFLCYSLANEKLAVLSLAFGLGFSLGCGQPVAMSLVYSSSPAHRSGEAIGVRSALIAAVQTVMPMVFGALAARSGTGAVIWIVAVAVALGSAFSALQRGVG